MTKYICTIVVEVDENKVKLGAYESNEDYLNDCSFEVYDDESENIVVEVRDYQKVETN